MVSSSTDSLVLNINTDNVTMYYYNMASQTIRILSSFYVAGDLYLYIPTNITYTKVKKNNYYPGL